MNEILFLLLVGLGGLGGLLLRARLSRKSSPKATAFDRDQHAPLVRAPNASKQRKAC
jgi:hypothetical protein